MLFPRTGSCGPILATPDPGHNCIFPKRAYDPGYKETYSRSLSNLHHLGIRKEEGLTSLTFRVMTNLQSRTEILRNLTAILGMTRVQPGCSSCRLYSDIEEPKAILLSVEWLSRSDLERYIRSDDFRRVLATVELSDAPPEVHFDQVSMREGLEIVDSVRLKNKSMPEPQS
jgi:quinol monooxygenase YgiN